MELDEEQKPSATLDDDDEEQQYIDALDKKKWYIYLFLRLSYKFNKFDDDFFHIFRKILDNYLEKNKRNFDILIFSQAITLLF